MAKWIYEYSWNNNRHHVLTKHDVISSPEQFEQICRAENITVVDDTSPTITEKSHFRRYSTHYKPLTEIMDQYIVAKNKTGPLIDRLNKLAEELLNLEKEASSSGLTLTEIGGEKIFNLFDPSDYGWENSNC